jgi:hypothetical protein
VIRPRCEAAIKLKKTINLDEDLLISDQEFVAKTGISKEVCLNIKNIHDCYDNTNLFFILGARKD